MESLVVKMNDEFIGAKFIEMFVERRNGMREGGLMTCSAS